MTASQCLLFACAVVSVLAFAKGQEWRWDGQRWVQAAPQPVPNNGLVWRGGRWVQETTMLPSTTTLPTTLPRGRRPRTTAPPGRWAWSESRNRWEWIANSGQDSTSTTPTPRIDNMARDLERGTDCDKMQRIKQEIMTHFGRRSIFPLHDLVKRCTLDGDQKLSPGILTRVENNIRFLSRKKRGIVNFERFTRQKWPNGVIYVQFAEGDQAHSDELRATIRRAMAVWSGQTCIEFVEVPTGSTRDRARIVNGGTGCITFVGKSELNEQTMFLPARNCFRYDTGEIIHELGHLIGLFHEHERPDRDNHIGYDINNVQDEETGNFLVLPNVVVNTWGAPYDESSIMHYDTFAFTRAAGTRVLTALDPLYQNNMGQRVQLSYYDIFKVNQAYCQDRCTNRIQCVRGHQNPRNCNRCICPDGFSGARCTDLAPSSGRCGGELTASFTPRNLDSPGYPQGYANNEECYWKISASPGFNIEMRFLGAFGIYANDKEACFHRVEVKYKANFTSSGPWFCTQNRPTATLTSETNEVYVIFKSTYSNTGGTTNRGFRLQYQSTEPSPCSGQQCQNGGTCSINSSQQGGFTCTCTPGWTGRTCANTDECPVDACNGRAQSCRRNPRFPNSFFCECLVGFEGDDCGTDLCAGYCMNGGTCSASVVVVIEGQQPGRRCTCPEGWTGTRCEAPVPVECPMNACLNGGTCVPSSDRSRYPLGYYCECLLGFLSDNCGEDTCSGTVCRNGGTCIRVMIGNPRCSCATGFTGEQCETPEACQPDSCSGQGRCVPVPTTLGFPRGYYCDCFAGFRTTAQRDDCINPCASGPCENGGSCLVLSFGDPYRCRCPAGFTGNNCQNQPDPCSGRPCGDNGVCVRRGSAYQCTCNAGFVGRNCQIRPVSTTPPVNACDSNPCQNGGTCRVNSPNGRTYTCSCPLGTRGTNCQIVPPTVNPGGTAGPITDPCSTRTCGGFDLEPGHVSKDVCNGPSVARLVERRVNCRMVWPRGSWWPREVCDTQQVQRQVETHTCCNGALNVTAERFEGRRNVPICVMPGWERAYTECPTGRRLYCGGCSKSTLSRWGIVRRRGCDVFERIETLERQCESPMCNRCPYWKLICGECAHPGQCCDHSVPASGNRCVPDGEPPQPRENPHDMPGVVTVLPPEEGFDEDYDLPRVSDARYDTGRNPRGGSSSRSRERHG